ncbi:MAG TPA: HEAT repeat domain-containing protein [Polyangiaceae bacterium]|jgi:HEAT repeat protein
MKRVLAQALVAAVSCMAAASGASCASSPAMHAAESGDRLALKAAVDADQKAGDLSTGDAASLAKTVASREVVEARGEEGIQRVHDAWPCAHELDDALDERMKTHDEAGALAALARIDGRGLGLDDARDYLVDPDGPWRAVGARGLVRAEDHAARLHALLDPDPGVRREAARAARDATDPNDLDALAEAARVDPALIVRTEAVRAIAALTPLAGDDGANALRDLWASGDDGLREDIALAWAGPAVWNAGGEGALRVVVASDHGPGAVEAAAAVLRHHDVPAEIEHAAIAQLVRSIDQGGRATRLQAIAQAPLDRPEVLASVTRAADDDDPAVRVGALARLGLARQPGVTAKLEAYAQPGAPESTSARFALASMGDRRVQAWIEQGLVSERSFDRLSAATALASLGVPARAAPLLADADPGVRVRAACTILMAARVR